MVATALLPHQDAFVAGLATAAYQVALRHGIAAPFARLQLDLWHELREVFGAEELAQESDPWPA